VSTGEIDPDSGFNQFRRRLPESGGLVTGGSGGSQYSSQWARFDKMRSKVKGEQVYEHPGEGEDLLMRPEGEAAPRGSQNLARQYEDTGNSLNNLLQRMLDLRAMMPDLIARDPKSWQTKLLPTRYWEQDKYNIDQFFIAEDGADVIKAQADTYLTMADQTKEQGEDPQTRERMNMAFPMSLIDFMGDDEAIDEWIEGELNIRAGEIAASYKQLPSESYSGLPMIAGLLVLALLLYNNQGG
jgi:hypothetical protein